MDTSQTFGTASSYSRKYAMSGLFLIDDTKDADSMDNSKSKPALKSNSSQFLDAISFIKKGGSMETIEAKYNVSSDVKKQIAAKLV